MSLHAAECSASEATGPPAPGCRVIRATSNIGQTLTQQWHTPRRSLMITPVCYVNQSRQNIYETIVFCKAK